MMEFKYLGWFLNTSDDDYPAVVANFFKSRSRWVWFSRILGWEGEDLRTSRSFYKAVFQATLLFGSETWVMTPRIGSNLGGFHHRVDLLLAVMQPT